MLGILGPLLLIFILSAFMRGHTIKKYKENEPDKIEYKYRPVNALTLFGEENLIKTQFDMFSTYFERDTEYQGKLDYYEDNRLLNV